MERGHPRLASTISPLRMSSGSNLQAVEWSLFSEWIMCFGWIMDVPLSVELPYRFNSSQSDLQTLFCSLNGLLLPGGDYDLVGSLYQQQTEFLINLVIQVCWC